MAIELGKVNVTDLSENNYKALGIGINRKSNSNGIFAVNYTTLSQAEDNLTNLIMTRKGERVEVPEFGCGIWELLFDQIDDNSLSLKIENSILEAVSIYLPYIKIQEIIFDYDDNDIDNNRISLDIKFALASNSSLSSEIKIDIKN